MIKNIVVGDITGNDNSADIIIGMNSQLDDVTGIGLPFVSNLRATHPIQLGCVLSFEYDRRQLHMILCHHLGRGGWRGSDMHVRFGMDYLWQKPENQGRDYSIVQIGTGRVGKRDGANPALIHAAMATSFLPVTLFVFDNPEQEAATAYARPPLKPLRVWNPTHGEELLLAA